MEKRKKLKTQDVFWSPANFSTEDEQWGLLYEEPKPVLFTEKLTKSASIIKCPAVKHTTKNLFAVSSLFKDEHFFEKESFEMIANMPENYMFTGTGLIALRKTKPSSFENFVNVNYNQSWLFFSQNSLLARFTAPYFPAVAPAQNALLAMGEFDIGKWFRPFNLDYHLPINTTSFVVQKNQPLFFMELFTDKKIVFHRFLFTVELMQLAHEMAAQSERLPKMPLLERYELAKRSGVLQIIQKLVKEAVI